MIHAAVHLHLFLAGCLLRWVIIGIDPVRRRPGLRARIATLVIAGAGHDTLAKLMYARNLPVGGGLITDRQFGAELMYYGGTIIDLALAIIAMTQWYQASGRELACATRRSASATRAPAPALPPARRTGRRPSPRTAMPRVTGSAG